MSRNTPSGSLASPQGTRTAEQVRWSNYYLMRDIELAGPALYMLGRSDRVIPETDSFEMEGVASTAVDAVLPAPTVPAYVPVYAEQEYHAPDLRGKREQRMNRTRYGKAKAYYGKTYIVPRSQMIWAGLIGFGGALMVGSVTALAILHSFS
jgi:hypothetical protein